MDIVFFVIGGFVIAVFLFDRSLLFEPETHRIILGIAAVMFVVGAVLVFGSNWTAGALMNPLVSIGLLWVMRKLFRWWVERDPLDTFMNWKPGMAADRLFNIIYFTSAFICWGLIAAGAEKLADRIL